VDIPFIIVSGYIEEDTAVAAMQAGAHDYIMKDRLARLVPAVERELREAQVRGPASDRKTSCGGRAKNSSCASSSAPADLRAANLALEKVIKERKRLEMSCSRSPKTNGAGSGSTCTTIWARS